MKLIDIVNARAPLQKLVQQDLPLRTAWELVKVTDAVNRCLSFYAEELTKLGSEPDPVRLQELQQLDVQAPTPEPFRIQIQDGLRLSAADVKLLEPLITFTEED